ncbi:MAG: hypothetical protein EBS89_03490 [Proteobacteria bacterium]|nr:hypothetical protein [Pseudomonadota bacterium]
MGLDSFWVDENSKKASVPGEFRLVGGMLSGHGNDSFRGKCYNGIVEAVTGVSLYQEKIGNEVVREMSDKLGAVQWSSQFGFDHDIDESEFRDLVRMFRLHADEGHSLCGWW